MIATKDLRLLSGWCTRHRMSWVPGRADDGEGGLLLLAGKSTRRGDDLMLLTDTSELRLLDGQGSVMASASDLPALLDALDAGMRRATDAS